jgi:DnaJ-class molecular chaperone
VLLQSANEVISSFAGGTVGCMGTLIALELAKQRVKEREGCPYCSGKGKLPCAQCYGSGVILVQTSQDGLRLSIPCQSCKGQRAVDCNICRGDGLSIPSLLEKKLSDVPEGQAQTESY